MPLDKPISQHVERLPVLLTQDELRQRGIRLAELEGNWATHCQTMKSEQSTLAARKKELEAQIQQVAATVRDGKEWRDVTVSVVLDGGEALELRADTSEVLRRRPIREDEAQAKLFEDTAPADPGEEDGEEH